MNTKLVRLLLLVAALFAGGISSLSAAEPSKENAALATKMLKALETGTFEEFIAEGDTSWKKLQKGQFDGIAGQIGPRLKSGYDAVYLGELKRSGGTQLTLWKIVFKGGGDDMPVTMAIKDGKITAFGFPRL